MKFGVVNVRIKTADGGVQIVPAAVEAPVLMDDYEDFALHSNRELKFNVKVSDRLVSFINRVSFLSDKVSAIERLNQQILAYKKYKNFFCVRESVAQLKLWYFSDHFYRDVSPSLIDNEFNEEAHCEAF